MIAVPLDMTYAHGRAPLEFTVPANYRVVADIPPGGALLDRSRCEWIDGYPKITVVRKHLSRHFNREGDQVIYGRGEAAFDGMTITNGTDATIHASFTFTNGCRR